MTSGGLLGVWGKWVKHAKYIYNIQDFNPEDAPTIVSVANALQITPMDVSDNIVSVEIKNGIVHTKWDSFRGIYIVPMKKGEFKAKVELMCAEYEEPEKTELTFVCE